MESSILEILLWISPDITATQFFVSASVFVFGVAAVRAIRRRRRQGQLGKGIYVVGSQQTFERQDGWKDASPSLPRNPFEVGKVSPVNGWMNEGSARDFDGFYREGR